MPEITEAERQERLKELFRLLAEEQEHRVDVGGGLQLRRVDDGGTIRFGRQHLPVTVVQRGGS